MIEQDYFNIGFRENELANFKLWNDSLILSYECLALGLTV